MAFVIREILYSKLILDICAYHNGKEPGFIISYFYEMPGWNGFHPAPNLLNQILTALFGGIIGFIIYLLIKKLGKRKNALQQCV